jgi:hypothetical protein
MATNKHLHHQGMTSYMPFPQLILVHFLSCTYELFPSPLLLPLEPHLCEAFWAQAHLPPDYTQQSLASLSNICLPDQASFARQAAQQGNIVPLQAVHSHLSQLTGTLTCC